MGFDTSSNTLRVRTQDGIKLARSITRRPESERWSTTELSQVTAVPSDAWRAARRDRAVEFEDGAEVDHRPSDS